MDFFGAHWNFIGRFFWVLLRIYIKSHLIGNQQISCLPLHFFQKSRAPKGTNLFLPKK